MDDTTRSAQIGTNPPRIEALTVSNYRALKRIEIRNITPLTVLLGPNGSGKSTLFDVFSFLSECFTSGLRSAWDHRGRLHELRTRGAEGPISFDLKYREQRGQPVITYHLAIDEGPRGPIVVEEWLSWTRGKRRGRPFRFLEYHKGEGSVVSGEVPDADDQRRNMPLRSPDLIAANTLGQIADHPRVAALREFITDWYVSYLSVNDTRGQPVAGPQPRLSRTGDNMANVVQFLKEQYPERLDQILDVLQRRVPRLERVDAELMPDGRLLLQIKDAPFEEPVLARFASDGTLKMLAYLIVLYDPEPSRFIGIEEPENHLHHRLLPSLAEECRAASARSQLLVTTHSPYLVNGLRAKEVRILHRDEQGYAQIVTAADIPGVKEFLSHGASLGDLWLEGYLGAGEPLSRVFPLQGG